MRSIARACAAALPLLGLALAPVPAQSAGTKSFWLITTADEDESPLAILSLEGHPSLNQLTLLCAEKDGIALRISAMTTPGPNTVTIASASGRKAILSPDADGMVPEAQLFSLIQLYENATGLSGDAEPKERVPFAITSDREKTKATYDFRAFNHTTIKMRMACADWRNPPAEVAAPVTRGPRTRIGGKFEDYCVRHNREPTKEAQCACLTDAVIQVSNRDNPGYQGYPDIVMSTIYAYREAMITGSSPEFDVRMILMGVPGNPAANPAQMITRAVRVNDEAVAMCTAG